MYLGYRKLCFTYTQTLLPSHETNISQWIEMYVILWLAEDVSLTPLTSKSKLHVPLRKVKKETNKTKETKYSPLPPTNSNYKKITK